MGGCGSQTQEEDETKQAIGMLTEQLHAVQADREASKRELARVQDQITVAKELARDGYQRISQCAAQQDSAQKSLEMQLYQVLGSMKSQASELNQLKLVLLQLRADGKKAASSHGQKAENDIELDFDFEAYERRILLLYTQLEKASQRMDEIDTVVLRNEKITSYAQRDAKQSNYLIAAYNDSIQAIVLYNEENQRFLRQVYAYNTTIERELATDHYKMQLLHDGLKQAKEQGARIDGSVVQLQSSLAEMRFIVRGVSQLQAKIDADAAQEREGCEVDSISDEHGNIRAGYEKLGNKCKCK